MSLFKVQIAEKRFGAIAAETKRRARNKFEAMKKVERLMGEENKKKYYVYDAVKLNEYSPICK